MFQTPYSLVRAARVGLTFLALGGILVFAGLGFSAIAIPPRAVVIALVLFAVSSLMLVMVAFPHRRRRDLLLMVLAMIAVWTVLRWVGSPDPAALIDGCVAAVVAILGYCTTGIELLRSNARSYGNVRFEIIEIEDRRARRRYSSATGRARARRSAAVKRADPASEPELPALMSSGCR